MVEEEEEEEEEDGEQGGCRNCPEWTIRLEPRGCRTFQAFQGWRRVQRKL